MVIFKRKQIVILSLILMIIAAGYLQYNYKQNADFSESINVNNTTSNSGRIGEAVYVDSKVNAVTLIPTGKPSASKKTDEFFSQAKIDRETSRGKDKDALKEISNDSNASKDVRAKAYEQMMKLVSNSDKEMKIETLIKEKGFSNAVVLMSEDESVDIIIKSPSLNASQVAQISDIASRYTNIQISNIHIKNIY